MVDCHDFELRNLRFHGNRTGREESEEPAHSVLLLGCKDFRLSNIHVEDPVVDGFYFGYEGSDPLQAICENGVVENCSTRGAWRCGAGVINARNLSFVDCRFTEGGVDGTLPKCGVDVESDADAPRPSLENIQFTRVEFSDNIGYGLQLSSSKDPEAVTVSDCWFENNVRGGILVGTNDAVIRGCRFRNFSASDSTRRGTIDIPAADNARSIRIEGNLFQNIHTKKPTIFVHSLCGGPVLIRGNIFENVYSALSIWKDDVIVSNNVIQGSISTPIICYANRCLFDGNRISNATEAAFFVHGEGNKILNNFITDTIISSDDYGTIVLANSRSDIRGNHLELTEPNRNAYAVRVDSEADVSFLKNNILIGYGDSDPTPSIYFHGEPTGFVGDNIED